MTNPAIRRGTRAGNLPPEPAEYHFDPAGGHDAGNYRTSVPRSGARRAVHILGAVVSLVLLGLGGYWGYKQTMRDLHGVPVVRALEGPMRVAPENPGGEISDHAGLSVNEVQASGAAAAPEAELVLAPEPVPLTDEDLAGAALHGDAVNGAATTDEATTGEATTGESATADAGKGAEIDPEQRAEQLHGMIRSDDPIAQALADAGVFDEFLEPKVEEESTAGIEEDADPDQPQVARPAARPGATTDLAPPEQLASVTAAPAAPVDPSGVAPGTRLVQLGAYDTPEDARAAWDGLAARFAGLMQGKSPVVVEAQAGGRSFWRLRALGFDDLSAARRFCAALVAERADCIPVVAR